MRLLLIFCLAAFITSCNDSSNKNSGNTIKDSINRVTTSEVTKIEPVKITAADVPASIKIKGKIQEAWKWKDKNGENIMVMSVTEPYGYKDKFDEMLMSSELYATCFLKNDTGYTILWKVADGIKECFVDLTCEILKGSTSITDLDKNGIAETKVQYITACRGDVSPSYMYLIMYEGNNRYSLRGSMWLKSSDEDKFTVTENDVNLEKLPKKQDEYEQILQSYGRYETEKNFATAPAEFLSYARREWLKYVIEKIGE
ncbi:MAG: hypothetical protein WBC06_05455 [Chitinophagaceae bacterium]